MINEFSTHPKPTNNKAKISFFVFLALFVFGTAAYILMRSLDIEKSGLIGFIPLVSVTVAVFFYNKYLGVEYFYDITLDSDGTALFVVRQLIGKRQSTLCRIALYEMATVEKETPEERKTHKTPAGYVKYSYIPTFLPDTTYRITSRSRYERSEIIIECSDEFAEMLKNYIMEAKGIEASREEDGF